MEKKKFFDQYKDPRWQKKRLKIMERDNFTCQNCESDERTLNVHHKYYIPNIPPWDYPNTLLVTLCEECHEYEEDCKTIHTDFTKILLIHGYLNNDLICLANWLERLPPGDLGIGCIVNAVKNYETGGNNG